MIRLRNLMTGVVGMLILTCPTWAQGRAASRPARQRAPEPVQGQAAPDFELHRLETGKDKDGKDQPRVSDQTVRLSGFKGKKPVCLIFSSYT